MSEKSVKAWIVDANEELAERREEWINDPEKYREIIQKHYNNRELPLDEVEEDTDG